MGLNITAYGRLTKIKENEIEFSDYGLPLNDRIKSFFSNPYYPYHISGIDSNNFYICKGEKFSFRAGSAKGYNQWKDNLSKVAGYANRQQVWNKNSMGPFVELINFSDCEGTIGSIISNKLLKDFQSYESQAKNSKIQFFYEQYKNWKKCLEIASNNGAISFY